MNPSHASSKETHARQPDAAGHFGPFGGRYIAETLMPAILELEEAYRRIAPAPEFQKELARLQIGSFQHSLERMKSWFTGNF